MVVRVGSVHCCCTLVLVFLGSVAVAQLPDNTATQAIRAVDDLVQRRLGNDAIDRFHFVLFNNSKVDCAIHDKQQQDLPCFRIGNDDSNKTVSKIVIGGSSSVELAAGLNYFLRTHIHESFSWNRTGGSVQKKLPDSFPLIPSITVQRKAKYSYYQNVVTASYSMVWWDWERWEEEIDWMALNGINLALAYTGQEHLYRKVFMSFNVSQSDLDVFFDGPAFLAWSRGQGKSGLGGPLPSGWYEQQWELLQKIVSRQAELGIGSILPAFEGNVPPVMEHLYPNANISNGWLDALDPLFEEIASLVMKELVTAFGNQTHFYQADGFFNHATGPWIDQSNSKASISDSKTSACVFSDVVTNTVLAGCGAPPYDTRLQKSQNVANDDDDDSDGCVSFFSRDDAMSSCLANELCMGVFFNATTSMYVASPHATQLPGIQGSKAWSIENPWTCRSIVSDAGARERASVVYNSIIQYDANAVWVYQGWIWMDLDTVSGFGYIKGFTSAVPAGGLIILDMEAEYQELWRWSDSFQGTDFIWAAMDNFGGNNGLYGDISLVFNRTTRVKNETLFLCGFGISMEGIDQNPAYYQAVLDSAWNYEELSLTSFLKWWGKARCGADEPNEVVLNAYSQLGDTVYSPGQLHSLHHVYSTQMLPVIGTRVLWRGSNSNSSLVLENWKTFVEGSQYCGNSSPFLFDMVDVGREALVLGPGLCYYDRLMKSFDDENCLGMHEALVDLLEVANDLDDLMASQSGLMLGSWLEMATILGMKMNASDQMVWNALSQLTLWNPYDANTTLYQVPIHTDYAIKMWSGLQNDYHSKRLAIFVAQACTDFANEHEFNVQEYTESILKFSVLFENNGFNATAWPVQPKQDPFIISNLLAKKYANFQCVPQQ
eukprot:m.53529 g.53529  ORF g.53529 m.53529 type:complete len:886 (+) comp7669_c0_seq2:152-2809(+)